MGEPDLAIAWLRPRLEGVADTEAAEPMAAYMKHQFAFLGVKAAARRAAQKPLLTIPAPGDELLGFAEACWAEPEREFQYVAVDLLRKHVDRLGAGDLGRLEALIRTKSWWDTVDGLASWVVGPLVTAHDLQPAMDAWIDDADIWIARTAILHQLSYKEATDADRLFGYVERRAADTEFFIRKASGWALRQYARVDADAVRAFLASHDTELSELTKREAAKHL